MPEKNETPLLSPKFALALQFANEIHGTQQRKGLGAPYISHLMAVSASVLEHGGNETEAIAALLHDAAEDCGGLPMLETVRVMFGDDVAAIVAACTDAMEDPKPAWRPRKEAYVAHLASASPLALIRKPGILVSAERPWRVRRLPQILSGHIRNSSPSCAIGVIYELQAGRRGYRR